MTKIYRNRDERLGDVYDFTLPEIRQCYRDNGWDIRDDESRMSDEEIDADVLRHDIEIVSTADESSPEVRERAEELGIDLDARTAMEAFR